jgi:hypothetical protein
MVREYTKALLKHWSNVFGYISFNILLEGINSDPNPIYIQFIFITNFKMNTTLLGRKPYATRLFKIEVSVSYGGLTTQLQQVLIPTKGSLKAYRDSLIEEWSKIPDLRQYADAARVGCKQL